MEDFEDIQRCINSYVSDMNLHENIKTKAYLLWERLGRPDNKDVEIWDLASKMVITGLSIDEIFRVINYDKLCYVFGKVVELFEEDQEEAAGWFNHKQEALGGRIPYEVAKTEKGRKEVLDIIARLENGIFL